MSARPTNPDTPEEPMEERPLADRLRRKAKALAQELPGAIHRDVAVDLYAAADLIDAIGDREALRSAVGELNVGHKKDAGDIICRLGQALDGVERWVGHP